MKLRKILARGVAIAACAAMLFTNALAASELSIATAEDSGKLKVTLSGAVDGQVTFLAVDNGVALSDSTPAANMQYIAQEAKVSGTDTVITFAQRASGADKVDLYAGGENVKEVATVSSVYIKETAELTAASKALTCESSSIPADNAGWKTFLTDKIAVNYAEIGDTATTAVALTSATAADFAVTAGAATNNVYPIAVTYKGIDAGTVNVTAGTATASIVSIAATGITGDITVYVANAAAFTDADAKAAIASKFDNFKVVATYNNSTTSDIEFDDLTITYADGKATIAYGAFIAPQQVTINVITKAITAAAVKTAAPASVTLDVAEGTTVDADYVEANIVAKLSAFAAEYVWNDSSRTPVPAADLSYTATKNSETSYTVAITAAQAAFASPVTVAVTINVEAGDEEKTLIKGSVTATDSTGMLENFTGAIPVGAVITAIPYNADGMGNFTGTEEEFTAVATVVDANGNFELEVEPGKYTVIIAHTKYAIYDGDVYMARTVLNSNSKQNVTVADGEKKDLGAITLKYTYYGDINVDGRANSSDFGMFKNGFGSIVN